MKKNVIAAILGTIGLVGLTTSSYGQGSVVFNTYASTGYYPVTYSTAAQTALGVGLGAGPNVDVELAYFIGTSSDASLFTALPSTIEAVGTDTEPINGTGPVVAGYVEGGTVASIPGYAAGPISLEILAWVASGNGASAGYGVAGGYSGSFIWTEPSIAAGQAAGGYFQNLSGNAVLNLVPVPEPTTLALAGLGGLASLMAFRRKKA